MKRYKWVLSPSKFEESTGCPCYERQQVDTEYSIAGTNLHEVMEKNIPLENSNLNGEEKKSIQFCRDAMANLTSSYSLVWDESEARMPETNDNPRGIIDWIGLTEDGLMIIIDYKFGGQRVPAPKENYQLKSYLKAGMAYLESQEGIPKVKEAMAGIIQPVLGEINIEEFTLEEIDQGIEECRRLNDRYRDPFKSPDPSDPDKCANCANFSRCPAVNGAIDRFVEQASLLPMPSQLAPNAIVSERDRIIAQDLTKILETWIEQVKKNNREYAEQNGGTIGGIYNMTERSGGLGIEDVSALADKLVEDEWIDDKMDILNMVKVSQAGIVNGLIENLYNDAAPADVKAAVKEMFDEVGVPLPPVKVFRRGGKKKTAPHEELMSIPGLHNPFKQD